MQCVYNVLYTLKFSQWINLCIFHELVCICDNENCENIIIDNWSENDAHYVFAKIKTEKFTEPGFSRNREIKSLQKFQWYPHFRTTWWQFCLATMSAHNVSGRLLRTLFCTDGKQLPIHRYHRSTINHVTGVTHHTLACMRSIVSLHRSRRSCLFLRSVVYPPTAPGQILSNQPSNGTVLRDKAPHVAVWRTTYI